MRERGEPECDRDVGKADAQADPLPVPIGIQADQIARGRVEEEVPLRKEEVVEGEEQRLEREYRDDADRGDGDRGDQGAVAQQAPHRA